MSIVLCLIVLLGVAPFTSHSGVQHYHVTYIHSELFYLFTRCMPQQFSAMTHPCGAPLRNLPSNKPCPKIHGCHPTPIPWAQPHSLAPISHIDISHSWRATRPLQLTRARCIGVVTSSPAHVCMTSCPDLTTRYTTISVLQQSVSAMPHARTPTLHAGSYR